ncbi:hypothetical protein PAEPH01_2635 [Pancytospora epiphaga]|nr:hypothetical protein PAEPH01_2635 [Pancytospora epiphaga]
MRRVIRAIVTRQDTRDLSTCTNPESILQLKSLCEVQGLYVTQ